MESEKTYLCKILGTSWTDMGVFASMLRGRYSKIVPMKHSDLQRILRKEASVHSYLVAICSRVYVSQARG